MSDKLFNLVTGDILEQDVELSLAELCQTVQLNAEQIIELVEHGILEPLGREPANWRFMGISVQRVRCARRLRRDLGVNMAGAALALDLLEELRLLRGQLTRVEQRSRDET